MDRRSVGLLIARPGTDGLCTTTVGYRSTGTSTPKDHANSVDEIHLSKDGNRPDGTPRVSITCVSANLA